MHFQYLITYSLFIYAYELPNRSNAKGRPLFGSPLSGQTTTPTLYQVKNGGSSKFTAYNLPKPVIKSVSRQCLKVIQRLTHDLTQYRSQSKESEGAIIKLNFCTLKLILYDNKLYALRNLKNFLTTTKK